MKSSIIILISFFLFNFAHAQSPEIGQFDQSTDIGQPDKQGSAQYDEATQTYTLKGSGDNIWFEKDEFHFLHKKLNGDFILTANFELVGEGVEPQRKVGWMLRESLSEDAAHISAMIEGDGHTVLQRRALNGAYMRNPEDEISAPKSNYQIIQLEREGKKVTMRAAHMGEPLQEVGSYLMEGMSDEVFAGLAICAQNENAVEEAKVWNVRITKPVADSYNGFLSCRLETMNVFDGKRKVVYESNEVIESPNWMPDGQRLLTTLGGALYTVPVEGGELAKLNTGDIERISNDHGISFDGKQLAFTSSEDVEIGPRIYVMPLEGGTPKLLTEKAPSYWHGWSANNKEIYYVAQRDTTIYNIYKMAVKGGEEKQLTFNNSGYVDGPEASPDGKFIYYNDNASGTMQIWRMKTDGSDAEQLTFDEYNNWFPHVSPDGRWIVFLSYDKDVPPDAHPSYKRVTLRLMSLSGGAPKVIAHVYGGQGTMNVSSWSPDSQHISFVSNSGYEVEPVSRVGE
jgi:TolB protein